MEQYLIYDIETVALPWESFSESQQEYILRNAETEAEKEKKLSEMALSPLTSQIVCLGLQMMQSNEAGNYEFINRVAYSNKNQNNNEETEQIKLSTGDDCYICSEKKIIESFWKIFKKYPNIHLITFNGRNFDAPYIMLRSALLAIKPTRNLMAGTKFSYPLHTDLADQLSFFSGSFYGATKRFNFDFYTRAFGITSPKSEGIDGSKVAEFFHNNRYTEIAEYCLRDVVATWELFLKWKEFLYF